MSSRVSYTSDNKRVVEHDHYVELRCQSTDLINLRPCCRAVICTLLPLDRVGPFTEGLMSRAIPSVFNHSSKPLSGGTKIWYSFEMKYCRFDNVPFTSVDGDVAVRTLIRYIDDQRLEIIWKEDDHGYIITPQGFVEEKWELDKF